MLGAMGLACEGARTPVGLHAPALKPQGGSCQAGRKGWAEDPWAGLIKLVRTPLQG